MNITKAHASVHNKNYTQILNILIDHKHLSALAKFLLIYLLRQSPTWVFHDEVIQKELNCGRDKLLSLFNELRVAGFVKTIPIKGKRGTYVGKERIFAEEPIFLLENQKPCKNQCLTEALIDRTSAQPTVGKSGVVVNKTNLVNKTNNNNKQTKEAKMRFEPNDDVVVFWLKKLEEKNIEMGEKVFVDLLRKYGPQRIEEKLAMMEEAKPRNREGWLHSAIINDWKPKKPAKSVDTKPYDEEQEKAARIKYEKMIQEAKKPESQKARINEIKSIKEILGVR